MVRYTTKERINYRPNKLLEALFIENETPLKYKNEEVKLITIMYSGTEVVVLEEVKLVSLSTFIGGVGGNLGLFLGFSCLTSLFLLYEFILVLILKVQQKIVSCHISGSRDNC